MVFSVPCSEVLRRPKCPGKVGNKKTAYFIEDVCAMEDDGWCGGKLNSFKNYEACEKACLVGTRRRRQAQPQAHLPRAP
jgi:hypothetical protein